MFNFGNDNGMSLETLKDCNMDQHYPKLQTSDSVHPETKELENKQYEIEFKAEFDAFMKQKRHLNFYCLPRPCRTRSSQTIATRVILRVIQLSY
jgi:hypothetical protein